MAGGEGREQARMELLMTKADALPAMLAALGDTVRPGAGRADLVDLVARTHAREGDARVLPALRDRLHDPAPPVRAAVARALGRIGKKESIHLLLDRLLVEDNEDAQLEILITLEILDGWRVSIRAPWAIYGGDSLTPEERERFTERVTTLYQTATLDTLQEIAAEFYEKLVGQIVQDAEALVLRADLAGAEAEFRGALALKPDSRNAISAYGRFLFSETDRSQGLDLLEANGMVVRAPRLRQSPQIDGDLSDPGWARAARIDRFYQTKVGMRVEAVAGRAEAYVGHAGDRLWVATRVYEEDTGLIVARYTGRDGSVWFDDSVVFFFNTDLYQRSTYRTFVNCKGTLADVYIADEWDHSWDGAQRAAARVDSTCWTMEMEIPLKPMGFDRIRSGDVLVFNLAVVRAGAGIAPIAWMPAYGVLGNIERFGLLVFD